MYSVEDLLISHGYKLPKSGPPSAAPYDKRPADCQRELLLDSRAGRASALNGYEVERGGASAGGASLYGGRPAPLKGYVDNEAERRRKEAFMGILGDVQPLGDSLATDSGFYDVPSLTYSEPLSHDERDISYWRRRGQDFSILLDYADGRELRASAGAWRPQALIAAEELRAERQAQQLWEEISWLRDQDAPGQLRVTGERKCQSLGTEEWRPAVGLGRQLSEGDEERWALEPCRLRTPEVFFHPRTKAKCQSLPRVLSPDRSTGGELVPSRPSLPDRPPRLSSTLFSGPYSRYIYSGAIGRDRWGRNLGQSGHVALLPKPRFSRPLKPPSYEIHQQIRSSAEMLAIDQGLKLKDRPIFYSRGGELRHDYFAQHSLPGMEPPGYIPPPSYKRAPPPRAMSINRNEMLNLRWRSESLQPSSDPGRWLMRHTGDPWLEQCGERGVSYRKQVVPSGHKEQPSQARQVPLEDARTNQISGGPGGNSLTDSDKIRNINKENPSAKNLGQSTSDSAFPPQQGQSLNAGRKNTLGESDSSARWGARGLPKKSDSVGPEQNRTQFFPSSILGKPPPPPCKAPDPVVSEPVAEVKKVEQPDPPEKEKEKSKNLKKRLSETIFCLVSVPVTPQLTGTIRDQNNNDEKSPDPADSPSENKTGHLTNQSLQSTSSAEAELQALTGSIASSKTSSRASSKMFKKLPCRPPKINHYKELKLSGSWPANQYRDQETQTTPEAEKPGAENKEAQEDPIPAEAPEAPADSPGVAGTAFTFPIKGVKSLKLSSNSAFSLTTTFSNQLNKSTAQPPAVPPSGNVENQPAAGGGQEMFKVPEFLLKPIVSQRPWDAVKELEAIQKEVQDQQQQQKQQNSKQPSVDKCIEDLNEAYKDILELGAASSQVPDGSVEIPERIKIRLTSQPLNKPSSLRRSAVSWSVDPEYGEVKSAFSRPATKSVTFSKQLREELPVPPRESGFREYRVVPHLPRRRSNDGRTVKLDLPDEPIETPLSDFSPTANGAAAEVPWADRQPMQDASTLTSPPDYEDICQTLRQSRDPNDPTAPQEIDSEEDCPICKRELENQLRQGPLPPLHEENSSDSSVNPNESPMQGAADQSPAEDGKDGETQDSDLSGIEPQVNNDEKERDTSTRDDLGDVEETVQGSTDEPIDSSERSQREGAESAEDEAVAVETVGLGEIPIATASDDKEGQEKKSFALAEQRLVLWTHPGRDHPGLTEFPPERLPLSVVPKLDRRLSLSLEGERRGGAAPDRIEALQNKLAISPGRVAAERLGRMREVDVMYRMRRLSVRSTDSGDGDGDGEDSQELPAATSQIDGEDRDQEATGSRQLFKEPVKYGDTSTFRTL
ncbi:junctional cadherin 5-associated protein [Stigmatopora argus]